MAFALQSVVDLALQLVVRLDERTGTPAMRARCRIQVKLLEPGDLCSASTKKRKRLVRASSNRYS
jgi:hypothetical protein